MEQSTEEGNDQELIQSSTTPDPGHHMGIAKNTSKEISPFPALDHKAAMNRQDSMTDTKYK